MTPARFESLSLRLLRLFDVVYRSRSVSRAAEELQTTQSSVSLSLGRLRQHFDDPLFVRAGAGMRPTSKADALIQPVRAMLRIADVELNGEADFHPESSQRQFVLHMVDPAQNILLPLLIASLSTLAPNVRLQVRDVREDSQSMLIDGAIDLIVGFLGREVSDLRQIKLISERYVCIARVAHPRLGRTLSLEAFRSESHVVAAIAGTGHSHAQPSFRRLRLGTNIRLRLSSYFAVGETVAQTDLIAVVPSRLAAQLVSQGRVQAFELPMASPIFQVRQYWHARSQGDAGSQWLRGILLGIV